MEDSAVPRLALMIVLLFVTAVVTPLWSSSIEMTSLETRGDSSVFVAWETTLGGNDLFYHFVDYRTSPDGAWQRGFTDIGGQYNTTSLTIVGLTPGTAYDFRVGNANKSGVYSPTASLTMPGAGAIYLRHTGSDAVNTTTDTLRLGWVESSTPGEQVVIERRASGAAAFIRAGTFDYDASPATIDGLQSGTTYQWRAYVVFSGGGTSDYSNVITASTKEDPTTVKPFADITVVSIDQDEIDLTWVNNFNDPAYDFSGNGVRIEQKIGASGSWTVATTNLGSVFTKGVSTITITGLSSGTEYHFRMQGVQFNVSTRKVTSTTTDPSDEFTVTTPADDAPSTPGNFSASYSGGSVSLLWTLSGVAADGFHLQRRSDGDWTTLATINDGNTRSYIDSNVMAGTTYQYRVRAFVGSLDSPYTDPVEASVPGGSASTRSITIRVTPDLGHEPALTPADATPSVDGGSTAYSGLSPATDYMIGFTLTGTNG